jgi:hypothetical protein
MKKKQFLVLGIIILCVSICSNVIGKSSIDHKESARVFVQRFYNWYLVLWSEAKKNPSPGPTSEVAINQRPECFDLQLRRALSEDDSAQSKSGDIVGLDFDPFLRCQELLGNYQTGNVRQAGNKFLVDIRNIEKGSPKKEIRDAELRVVVELVRRNGHWIFINFIYPDKNGNSNLPDILKSLRKDRVKSGYEKS